MNNARTGHRGARWTFDEDRRLLDLIEAGKSPVFVAGALKRTTQSILNRARKLTKIGNDLNGAFTKKIPRWTLEEDKRLRRLAEEGRSAEVISERTKRSIDSVLARAQRLEILLKRR